MGKQKHNVQKPNNIPLLRTLCIEDTNQGHPTRKNRKNASNAVFCFLISFYGLLKGYFCELTLFDLFGCGS